MKRDLYADVSARIIAELAGDDAGRRTGNQRRADSDYRCREAALAG